LGDGDKPIGERVASLEAIVPLILEGTKSLETKMDKLLETVGKGLDAKASKDEVKTLSTRVDEVQKKVWVASGGFAVLATIAGWFGKSWFTVR
jgi:hypothetical protein